MLTLEILYTQLWCVLQNVIPDVMLNTNANILLSDHFVITKFGLYSVYASHTRTHYVLLVC